MTRQGTLVSWPIRLRASVVAGLLFIPACGLSSAARHQADHVFSTCSPIELEHQAGQRGVPAKAHYPDEATVRVSDVAGDSRYPSIDGRAVYGRPELMSAPDAAVPGGSVSVFPEATSSAGEPTGFATTNIRPAGHLSELQTENPYRFANYKVVDDTEGLVQASFIAAEPRIAQQPCPPFSSNQMETVAAGPMADRFSDEYVIDGGDRAAPFHYEGGVRHGLDSEDTIAEYSDNTGQHRVQPSNRVAVYSPRFGSVRTVSGLETDIKVDKAIGAGKAVAAGAVKTDLTASANVRGQGIGGLDSRRRADGVEVAQPSSQTAQTDRPEMDRKVDQGYEDRKYTTTGLVGQFDAAILSQQAQNAVVWTRNEFPLMTGTTTAAGDLIAVFRVQETVGVEDNRKTNGNLRLVKLADRETAQSGDTVRFTILFENTGDFDVYDVSIVDNLTTRLEYVEGSATIDAANPGEVVVTSNGEGSHVLNFRLDQPLTGHSRGTITFEAKVR